MQPFRFILRSILCLILAIAFTHSFAQKTDVTRTKAPNITFRTLDNKKVKLSSFQGKVVYMDFWASWCDPCFSAFPSVQVLKDKFRKNPNVVILTVGNDKKCRKWKSVATRKKVPGTNVWGGKKEKALDLFNVDTLPKYILIDKKGRVYSFEAPGPYSVEGIINQLLQE